MTNQDLQFEMNYWGDCCNTFDEDQKHYVYAKLMNIDSVRYSFDVHNKSILDIGGGPTSMLLKTINLKRGRIYDPIKFPSWTIDRYKIKNIDVIIDYGENINESGWDEVWMYNCLQHTTDPKKIIENAKKAGSIFRIFEWIDIPPHDGHPNMLTKAFLDECIGYEGLVYDLAQQGCYGKAYAGVFIQ